jgi:hypothetical protein
MTSLVASKPSRQCATLHAADCFQHLQWKNDELCEVTDFALSQILKISVQLITIFWYPLHIIFETTLHGSFQWIQIENNK